MFVFNCHKVIVEAIIGFLLISFYNSKNLECVRALFFYEWKKSIGNVFFYRFF